MSALPPIAEWGAADVTAWPVQADGRRNVKIAWPLVGVSVMVCDEPARTDAIVDVVLALIAEVRAARKAAAQRSDEINDACDGRGPREWRS